jgi:hypothetical protein
MPKPLKKRAARRPKSDPNEAAFDLVRRSTEADTDEPPAIQPAQLSAYMAALGRKGGRASGAKRMENLTDEQRSAIALKAARARWAKRRPNKKQKPV